MLARLDHWLDRHPAVADGALAAVLLVLALVTLPDSASDTVAGWLVTVALVAPLAVRRRWPTGVFAAVMVVCAVQLALVDELLAADVAALVALYTLVVHAPRRLAAVGFAVALAGTAPFAVAYVGGPLDEVLAGVVVFAVHLSLAALLGDRIRARVGERAALRERAELLVADRDRRAAEAAAAERARIARELHDVVAHSLSVVIHQADGGRYAARTDPAAATAALETIARTAREAQGEMRRALGVLGRADREAPMAPQPGVGDLEALLERTRAAGLAVELVEHGSPRPLSPGTDVTVYRVVQEALTNVLRHAGTGAAATVTLRWEPRRLTVVVADDGRGRPAAPDGGGSGRGLVGMRERVEPRGGSLRAGPRAGGGFAVEATLPVDGSPVATGAAP